MIKVQSLLSSKPNCRPMCVQTDPIFPKLTKRSVYNYSTPTMEESNYNPANNELRGNKFCKTGLSYKSSPTNQLRNTQNLATLKKEGDQQTNKKPNNSLTTNFKFLAFEQKELHQLIVKYLGGQVCSREDKKLLNKKISLSFFQRKQQIKENLVGSEHSRGVPEIESINVSLKSLVDGVTEIYQQKKHLQQSQREMIKNVGLTVQKIVLEKKIIPVSLLNEGDSACTLKMYLKQYMNEIEFCKKRGKHDEKSFLLRFYRQIYNRYEKVPFSKQQLEDIVEIEQNQKQNSADLSPPTLLVTPPKRKKATVNESFIRLRFFNNFRKEVEGLSQNTEKILNEEMNRLTQL